jgi:outer membrane protein
MKRNIIRLAAGALVALACLQAAVAEQLTTVAVVDTARVYTTFFKESQAVRDWEKLKLATQDELNKYFAETTKLNADRLEAVKRGDATEAMRLEQDIARRNQFYNDYKKVKQQQIADIGKSLSQSDSFLSEVQAAIKYVAEGEGYTVVFDAATSGLRFYSPEIDITDKVLEQLKKSGVR